MTNLQFYLIILILIAILFVLIYIIGEYKTLLHKILKINSDLYVKTKLYEHRLNDHDD